MNKFASRFCLNPAKKELPADRQNFGDDRIVQPCSVSRIEWERNKKPLLELQDTDDTDVP